MNKWTKLGLGLTLAVPIGFYLQDSRSGIYTFGTSLLHSIDAEDSHALSIKLASTGLVPKDKSGLFPSLRSSIFGFEIDNPIGLAAGYDKNGEAIDALFGFGFGLVEIGSVTPLPQEGNPKPRFFRLPLDGAVINRYGFNSQGHESVKHRLRDRLCRFVYSRHSNHSRLNESDLKRGIEFNESVSKRDQGHELNKSEPRSLKRGQLLGINLGKNKTSMDATSDYVQGVSVLGPFADYIVINISSPNTAGLRDLQASESLSGLLTQVKIARDQLKHCPPLLVKIAPDLTQSQVEDIAQVVLETKIDGCIISNTTVSRPKTLLTDETIVKQFGGLSGKPLKPLALQVVSTFYKATKGQVPIIGAGGISNAQDALEFCKAGASVVQLYTALGYQGPGLIPKMKTELDDLLKRQNSTWQALIGSDHPL